ncbi:CBS domain-containing protein CBSCBSPB1-like isoform X2 [Phalaenopsis equestris]|uniref:CBS domain-containing protein CBSCBSPB1-like isoform X2 n=1 Tax=Phalaenopsis equestris TaxID=78828 RepID=UPI0009E5C06C|nr:CBS domain-containing protein CBSCBSPB1-like isoform X2 [Phalaenopsis equestris]
MDSVGSQGEIPSSGSSSDQLKPSESSPFDAGRKTPIPRSMTVGGERTVKRLKLSKALTMPESSSILEVCRRMAARRVDAALLIESNAFLCGILTDKDIATRVMACEIDIEKTPVSEVMTPNPVFVLSDTLAVEALQKMLKGKFRHLPVVENGEVIALLDIAKCLYDAIARMERVAEKGKAIAAAVEGLEMKWGATVPSPNTFIESLQEKMFRPCLSTILPGYTNIAVVSRTDSVLMATKKMLELEASSAIVTVGNKLEGILTSSDILMRVIAKSLPPSTSVEEVMTANPECGTIDTPILDALQIMNDGKFLHLPVVDRDGNIISVIDVIHVTDAAVAIVESTSGLGNETAASMMQKFWDSAMAIGPSDEEELRSEASIKFVSEAETSSSPAFSFSGVSTAFSFKLEDKRGRMHRFSCDTRSMTDLITCILQKVGNDINRDNLPQILYEDEDHDKVVLSTDSDLVAAVEHAKLAGWKGLRLYLDTCASHRRADKESGESFNVDHASRDAWQAAYKTIAAGAALVVGLSMVAYLKRSGGSS